MLKFFIQLLFVRYYEQNRVSRGHRAARKGGKVRETSYVSLLH